MITRIGKLWRNLPSYLQVFGWKGLLCFARIRYSSSEQPMRMYFRASQHPVWLRPNSTDVMTMREIFIDRDYEFQMSSPVRVIVDAGANIGLATLYFAQKFPNAKIIAIEPEAGNFSLLKNNTENYPNVITLKAALWCTSGHISLQDPGRGAHGFITVSSTGPSCDEDKLVQSLSMSDLINSHQIECVDLLKIDIEGAEKEIFESSAEWIDRVSVVVAELHERFKPGCVQAFDEATHHMRTVLERGKLIIRASHARSANGHDGALTPWS